MCEHLELLRRLALRRLALCRPALLLLARLLLLLLRLRRGRTPLRRGRRLHPTLCGGNLRLGGLDPPVLTHGAVPGAPRLPSHRYANTCAVCMYANDAGCAEVMVERSKKTQSGRAARDQGITKRLRRASNARPGKGYVCYALQRVCVLCLTAFASARIEVSSTHHL